MLHENDRRLKNGANNQYINSAHFKWDEFFGCVCWGAHLGQKEYFNFVKFSVIIMLKIFSCHMGNPNEIEMEVSTLPLAKDGQVKKVSAQRRI